MGRNDTHDMYEEYRESEATRCALPVSSTAVEPSYDDGLDVRTHSAAESYEVLSPFVAPPEILGERSPAIRARRASHHDLAHHARAHEVEHECDEVTSFIDRSRPASSRAQKDTSQPLDYEALKRFLFEDGPDPGAPDYVPQNIPSMATPVSPYTRDVPSPPRPPTRAPMMSSHPELEGPRVDLHAPAIPAPPRLPMLSTHPDFEGPRGMRSGREMMMSSHPDFEGPRGARGGREMMLSSHPDFEGPRGGRGRDMMFSSHPDFEGPRGGRGPVSVRSGAVAFVEMSETHERLPQVLPAIVAKDSSLRERPFAVAAVAPPQPQLDQPHRAMHESSPSVDGSWVFSTSSPAQGLPAYRDLDTSVFRASTPKMSLSFIAAVVTAVAALVVMVGAILFVRTDTRATSAVIAPPAADAFPTAPVMPPTGPQTQRAVANANARADQTAQLPSSQMAAPPPPEPVASAAAKTKKPSRKAKPVIVDEGDDEEEAAQPAPPPKKSAKKSATKTAEQQLAELQAEQLRR